MKTPRKHTLTVTVEVTHRGEEHADQIIGTTLNGGAAPITDDLGAIIQAMLQAVAATAGVPSLTIMAQVQARLDVIDLTPEQANAIYQAAAEAEKLRAREGEHATSAAVH